MYKVGDKIFCIRSSKFITSPNCEINKIYTIISVSEKYESIYYKIDDNSDEFVENSEYSSYFVDLKEHRKQKLLKLCTK